MIDLIDFFEEAGVGELGRRRGVEGERAREGSLRFIEGGAGVIGTLVVMRRPELGFWLVKVEKRGGCAS